MKRSAQFLILSALVCFGPWTSGYLGPITNPPDILAARGTTQIIVMNDIDFAPEDGSYNVNWPGPPRREWQDDDREFYSVSVHLSEPAPEHFNIHFVVKENRNYWPDPTLGVVVIDVREGETEPHGRFWLVCTKQGKVKGSSGKGDDGHAVVFLGYPNPVYYNVNKEGWTLGYPPGRHEHTVRCV